MSILDRIRSNGGEVIRDGYAFRLRPGRLSATAIKWVGEHKREIMQEIWPPYDDWEERAAIREYDGEQSRDEAENAAYAEVINA